MSKVLVAGLINMETTLAIDGFPVGYTPVRFPFFGVNSSVSGVGYNITKALTRLGHETVCLALIGDDAPNHIIRQALRVMGVPDRYVLSALAQTPQSVILYDPAGQRAIHTDLKDIQDQAYPLESLQMALSGCTLAVMCNINFTRALLPYVQQAQIPIATDVHAIHDLHDAYNADYMRQALILFQSHERLPCSPEEWVRRVWHTYGTPMVVIGLGSEGALLGVKDHQFIERIPAVYTRPVVNTVGAGDALFSAFVHTYLHTNNPYTAIQKAVIFASYKIGMTGAADGFLDAFALDEWHIRLLEKR
ncbi:MAG: carbohydrate kinase family protein [Armatimonadetes bacterium]|nr:carbohydrate kinase family protein [Anaerolineae bacterium]